MIRSRLVPVALALVALALLASPATASSPVGTYECQLGGTLKLKDNGKYDFNGEKGKWKEDGKDITFKTGSLKSVYGTIKHGVLKIYDAESGTEIRQVPS